MAEEKDAIDRETNVALELTDRGIKGGTNSRVLAALDLWFGRKLQGWAIKADRQARTEAARTEVQVNLIKAAGAIAIEKLGSDPELVREVLAEQLGQLRDNSRKQENKKAVLIEALDELKSTEPNATLGQPDDDASEIDEDMLNYLGSYAEKATSETMRKMWGRILAGELRRPRSFSLTTLRIISELRQEDANAFQQLVSQRFDQKYLFRDDKESVSLQALLDLETAGLLTGATGGLKGRGHLSFTMTKPVSPTQAHIVIGDKLLAVYWEESSPAEVKVPARILTTAGQEIAALLPIDVDGSVKAFVAAFDGKVHLTLHHLTSATTFSSAPILEFPKKEG